MANLWELTPEIHAFLNRQGVRVFWDPDETRGVLVGGQAVGLPPLMFLTPRGLWLGPNDSEVPPWWGSGWDFAHRLEPFPDPDMPALIQEARRQYYGRPLDGR